MYVKYELWKTSTGPTLFPATNSEARRNLKKEHCSICLLVFTAPSWEDACQKMNEYLDNGNCNSLSV